MKFGVVTLFPELVQSVASVGVTGRGVKNQLLDIITSNPRDFTTDNHRTVDDRPYGGGPGMVMKVSPLRGAVRDLRAQLGEESKVVYLSPQGSVINQRVIRGFASRSSMILVAGRYEGVDERFIESEVDEEWSLGDYVLSGGELAAMVIIDAVARLVPGVLGDPESAQQDSFSDGLLDCPHYTRPEVLDGVGVPQVLLDGHHAHIQRWRQKQSLGRTFDRRKDLIESLELSEKDKILLAEYKENLTK